LPGMDRAGVRDGQLGTRAGRASGRYELAWHARSPLDDDDVVRRTGRRPRCARRRTVWLRARAHSARGALARRETRLARVARRASGSSFHRRRQSLFQPLGPVHVRNTRYSCRNAAPAGICAAPSRQHMATLVRQSGSCTLAVRGRRNHCISQSSHFRSATLGCGRAFRENRRRHEHRLTIEQRLNVSKRIRLTIAIVEATCRRGLAASRHRIQCGVWGVRTEGAHCTRELFFSNLPSGEGRVSGAVRVGETPTWRVPRKGFGNARFGCATPNSSSEGRLSRREEGT